MKRITKKAKEAARMASPHPEDRFTDAEEDAMFDSGFQALKSKVAAIAKANKQGIPA